MEFRVEDIALRSIMERNARLHPQREVVAFENGERWTSDTARREARKSAEVLRAHGVAAGDRVAVFLPNGADFLRAWWGAHYLGAMIVPLNTALKGALLRHLVTIANPKLCVTHAEAELSLAEAVPHLPILAAALLCSGTSECTSLHQPAIDEPTLLMATSGTTGASKIVQVSALHFAQYANYIQVVGLDDRDRFLLDLPLFHMHAMGVMRSAQLSGVPVSLRAKPSLTRYWDIIRENSATAISMVGTTAARLEARPKEPRDGESGLKFVLAGPLPMDPQGFCRRFGIGRIATTFGSTELGSVLVTDPDTMPVAGSCGHARDIFDVKLIDGEGQLVRPGDTGELCVRPRHKAMKSSYFRNSEATEAAWRDDWFHTGDLLKADSAGRYYFVDRLKDSIRRQGENISSFEVEAEISAFPGIAEAACVAAPSDDGAGDEVKVWICPKPDFQIDFTLLAAFMAARVPKYMVPRFFEIEMNLPKTPSNKVQKSILRARGNDAATWDSQIAKYSAER